MNPGHKPRTSIRLATLDDLPAILEISNRAAEETAANFAVRPESPASWIERWRDTHERFPWLVAPDGAGDILGFAMASPWKGRCAYSYSAEVTAYVVPAHHGRGIGTALYARLFEMLAAQGYRTALGGITQPNPASVRLHESFGMKRVALFEGIGWKFGRWHDVGYWQIVLGDESAAPPGRLRTVDEVWENASP